MLLRKHLFALALVVSMVATADVKHDGAALALSTPDHWAGSVGISWNGASLITTGTTETVETLGNGLGWTLTPNPPYASIYKGPPLPELCDQFPLDNALANFYTAFSVEDGELVDLVGLGLPVEFALALVEFACENDADFASAASNAFLLNRAALQPLVTMDNPIKGHVKVFSILGLLSDAMGTVLIQLLEDEGIDTTGLVLTPVACDAIECLPKVVKNNADTYEVFDPASRQVMNSPFSANGNYDGDEFSNLDEAVNVLGRDAGVAEFVIAATNPDLDGSEAESMGCGAIGNTRKQNDDTFMFLPLLVAIALLVVSRRKRLSESLLRED